MQIFKPALLLIGLSLAAGCGEAPEGSGAGDPGVLSAGADESRIECAIGGEDWARVCPIERMQGLDGLTLTVRHPDGGFRRLLVTKDGRGVVPADGAETGSLRVIGADRIEVTVAGDRYRLPATVRR